MNLPLVNIHNQGRKLYLFLRNEKGNQQIVEKNDFFPYFYEPYEEGHFTAFNGTKLKRIYCSSPKEVREVRSKNSYSSDVVYIKRYLYDKVDAIEKSPVRVNYIDIEVLSDELPRPLETKKAKEPISCITLYDNFKDCFKQFYLGDYNTEWEMLEHFIGELNNNKPDIIVGYNIDKFDYPYLFYHIPDFARKVGHRGMVRRKYGKGFEDIFLPAGVSIVDLYSWIKKTYKGFLEYTLDGVSKELLGYGKAYKEVNFKKLNPEIEKRNLEDVQLMVKIMENKKLLDYFDEIRRSYKILWEDLTSYSVAIESRAFSVANKMGIVLPNKKYYSDDEKEDDFEGAFRKAFRTGTFKNITKYDLSGAYLYAVIDLCLDSTNIREEVEEDAIPVNVTDRVTNKILKTYYVKQNPNTILPRVCNQLIKEKNEFKKIKNNTNPESTEYKDVERKYDTVKAIVLSSWGSLGLKSFRLFDSRVAAMITSTIRDLIHYTKKELNTRGYDVVYCDTDSIFCNTKDNVSKLLNDIVDKWAIERFGKKVNIKFDYEGIFIKLFIKARCHYIGDLDTGHGIKREIKGMEAKRSNSSIFQKEFQKELVDKILNEYTKKDIIEWIKVQIKNIKSQPIENISFPFKLNMPIEEYSTEVTRKDGKTYKKKPYFPVQALIDTQQFIKFKKKIGDLYYCIYVKDEKGKPLYICFDREKKDHIKDIHWNKMIERNILNLAEVIFKANHWWRKEKRGQKFEEIIKEKL